MRFATETVNKTFGRKENIIFEAFGETSGVSEMIYCYGMVGVATMLYMQQIIYRKDYYYDTTMHYVNMLNDEDKRKVALEILKELGTDIPVS